MKKLISLLAVSMMLTFSFASCGDKDDSSDSSATKAASSDEASSGEASADEETDTTEGSTEASTEEKTTEAETTEETTAKKTTAKVTATEETTEDTTKGTSAKPAKVEIPGEIGGDIVGKWRIAEEDISKFADSADDDGMYKEAFIEFPDNNSYIVSVTLDISSRMGIKEEPYIQVDNEDYSTALDNKSFCFSGINCPILDFDGKSFRTGLRGSYYTFTRSEGSDDVYGSYDIPDDFGLNDGLRSGAIIFEKGGASYINLEDQPEELHYDNKTGKVEMETDSEGGSTISFEDEDTMYITSAEGETITLTRED